ncbi:MAG: hypothetical protein M1834_003875 [Cirrosporium novae-zelandiae]|nr:MAG: hypothetical protein M1834_003875 [Cirrosporium novae-zelandiae]
MPPLSSKPTPKPKTVVDWPPEVRQYVQRSFAQDNTIAGVSREEMEKKLKQVITEAAETNTLYEKPWDKMPLPQEMIQSEKQKALLERVDNPWKNKFASWSMTELAPVQHTPTAKKRKSSDAIVPVEAEKQPPWRQANNRNTFESRISYGSSPDKRQRTDNSVKNTSKSYNNLEKRKRRFENGHNSFQSPYQSGSSRDDSPMTDADQGPILGRCQTLEKKYFRLTSAPNPDTVRPLPVLKKTLVFLKEKWLQEHSYSYICDQFKSLRQDLTVQHIKNEFTVEVYELHAKIALEKGDLGEYNQCQTQLRALYSQELGGHPMEFKAYRILYFIHTCNRTDMNDVLADLTPADKMDPAVKHALNVRSALALGDYHTFFKLYLTTPNLGGYLIDMFVERERLSALSIMCKAYKLGHIKLRFITEELAFESDQETGIFLQEHGAAEGFLEQEGDNVFFLAGKCGALFEGAKAAAFKRVDIKGQI